MNEQGVTILLVEQNAMQALGLAHRAYILEQGGSPARGPGRSFCTTTGCSRPTWGSVRRLCPRETNDRVLFQTLVFGIFAGAIYGIAAMGLALVFGVMKILNIAHGELVMLGGYVGFLGI